MEKPLKPKLVIDVITLFPGVFVSPLKESIIRIGQEKGLVEINVHDLRTYTHDKRRTCDDKPFGGGPGMIMMAGPIAEAFQAVSSPEHRRIFLTPQGKPFTQNDARRLAAMPKLLLLCGHYEGIDERVRMHLIDEELSIGDFVMSGGEIPALCVIDALVRLVPGVLGNECSLEHESFNDRHLDHPHYTRPRDFNGWKVPEILISGDHEEVSAWRRREAKARTRKRRPDLLADKKN